MREALLEWRTYKYFPYERQFAWLEAERLFGSAPKIDIAGLRVPSGTFRQAERLTYFARAVHPSGDVIVPHQTQLEASAAIGDSDRQSTRYSAHGLHEYKGKFNPQIVRAIGNILGLDEGSWVLDPFCGSGTTLLECAHAGWNAVGVDRNPLAVFIANAKIQALGNAPLLNTASEALLDLLQGYSRVLCGTERISERAMSAALGIGWEEELPSKDYVTSWFSKGVLAQVVAIRRAIKRHIRTSIDRSVFETILSDLLRDVSHQDPADLRIRRRKNPQSNYPLIDMFWRAIEERLGRVVRARRALADMRGSQRAFLGDVRRPDFLPSALPARRRFDAIVTSPPYETALPYIDTQRLSLVLLGQIEANEIQQMDRTLIGSREIGRVERRTLEEAIRLDGDLPPSVIRMSRELLRAAGGASNGFRRVNRPALFFRYFADMGAFFTNVQPVLKRGGMLAMVVGTNRTTLNGKEYLIDTPALLADVAQYRGFELVEKKSMETYPRYDLHRRNSITQETLVILRRN